MRRIERGAAPEDFQKFARKHGHCGWKSLYEEDEPLFRRVCDILAKDQLGLSGYTEEPLRDGSRHVDHFLKREYYPESTFDWQNLIIDSNSEEYGAKRKDRRVTKADNARLINPVAEDPHAYFRYQADGRIAPRCGLCDKDVERAKLTIDAFGLNEAYLVRRRGEILRIIASYEDCGFGFEAAKEALANMGFPSVCEFAYAEG